MAVKPEVIKARLKALYPKANLSTKRLDAYAAKLAPKPADDADEAAIDEIINDYNEVIDFEAVAKEDDRIRTLEKKAAEAKGKGAGEGKGDDDDIDDDDDPTDTKTDKLLKGLAKTVTSLSSEIEALKSGKTIETKKATASKLFEQSEVLKGLKPELKEKWIERINVDSDTPVEEQIQSLEAEYGELVQTNANTSQYAPPAGGGNPKPLEADQAVVDKLLGDI